MLQGRLNKEILRVGALLFGVFIVLTLYTISVTGSLQQQMGEAEPQLDAMRSDLEAMYVDHINLLNFLGNGAEVEFSSVCGLDESSYACQAAGIRQQIMSGMTVDHSILLAEHQAFTQEAIAEFSVEMQVLREQTIAMRAEVMWHWQLYAVVLFLSLLMSGVWLYIRMKDVAEQISTPIDEMSIVSEQFVDGNYQIRASGVTIDEMRGLQSRFNAALDVIDTHISAHPEALESLQHLLTVHEQDILTFVKHAQEQERRVTFTDLRKHLGITFPTLRKYIQELTEKGFVRVVLDGREKIVTLSL